MNTDGFDLNEFVNLATRLGSDTTNVEVKACEKGLSKSITETISAFSNGSGGILICGLSEKDNFNPVEKFDAKRISDAVSQTCDDKMEPPVRATISFEEFRQKPIIQVNIPETAPHLKPCYIKSKGPYEGSFIRVGDGDRKLSRYEVDRLIEERKQPTYDAQVVKDASLEDFDSELVSNLLHRERANSPRIFATLKDEEALISLNIIKKGDDGSTHPTLAGIMALGKHPQKYFPRANVTFATFPGSSKEELSESGARFLDSRTIIGSIPVMLTETLIAVRRNMKITTRIAGGTRVDVPEYPEIAIRELVANALMHRDYSPEGLGSQVQVNMFSDRLEVISPGGLFGIVTVDNIGTYGASSSRNQFLSRILESVPYPTGYSEKGYVVENKGTGFAQVQASLKAQNMPPAIPDDSLSQFAVSIFKSKPSKTQSGKGTNRETTILDEISQKGSISTSEVAQLLSVSNATAYRHIKSLLEAGKIQSVGSGGRSTRYEIV